MAADDTSLLDAAKHGDARALAALYDAHADAVYGVALNLVRVRADAEDILQDVFVGLPEALHRFDHRGSFAGWLKRVAVRVALMKLRRQQRRREVELPEIPELADNPERVIDRVTLERALNRLPAKLRTAFVLQEIEGYSQQETAQFLGISRSAAGVRLFRAKRELRRLLQRFE